MECGSVRGTDGTWVRTCRGVKTQPWWRLGCAGMPASGVSFDHLFRVLARGVGQLGATQHARYFFGALFAGDVANGGTRAARGFLLFDDVVMVGEGGNLRQVRDAEDLIATGERF